MVKHFWRKRKISPPVFIAASFAAVIIAGTILLMLPVASKVPISHIDAFFTAVSATTVTGLSSVDISSTFTLFGEIVLLILIQIGGIGLMAFAVAILILFGRKVGMTKRIYLHQIFSTHSIGGTVKFLIEIITFVLLAEGIGFVLLSIVWVPEFGWSKGLYYSLFHVISAFNNAGFALFPDNLIGFAGNPFVTLIISSLFIVGGIGFIVVRDVIQTRSVRHWTLHTKMMIAGTLAMNTIAAIFVFILEYHNLDTIGNMPFWDKVWTSYFQAVTPRTAGFNMVDIGNMEDSTLLVTLLLMFIGGGSASTASGIKLTTFIIILAATLTFFRGIKEPHLFQKTIHLDIVVRSLAIAAVSSIVVFIGFFLLTVTESIPFLPLAIETVSAFGTVGLSAGITADLSPIGKLIICTIMFLGRIGPLTLFFLLIRPKKESYQYVHERVHTG